MGAYSTHLRWTIMIHLLFWLMLSSMIFLVYRSILGNVEAAIGATVINLFGFLILVYGHLNYLLPRYFYQRKYFRYALGLLLFLLATSAFRFFIGWEIVLKMKWDIPLSFTPSLLANLFLTGAFMVLITIPLRLVDNWFKKRELEKELKTHQLEAELRFLKAQVNPHFLFNALNNIYSLSFTESKKTPEMILKLSDMMSYMLYDCKNDQVPLSSEIAYLKNYIALQQLKKDGELNIQFDVEGVTSSTLITPMLFIPFFENAFKHGNLEDLKKGWLKSRLSVDLQGLKFDISNTTKGASRTIEKGGVGLENIRERLKLLFPNRHQLNIQKENDIFKVHLDINLSKPNHEI